MTNKKTTNTKPETEQSISLCQDLMFKIFFSRAEKALLSVIQHFIFGPKGKTIKNLNLKNKKESQEWIKAGELALKNPALYPKFRGGKGVVLDILATLNTGESVNIEMQSIYHAHFFERVLYYWSELYGSGFKSGKGYSALKPAYSLVFADFPLFKHFQGEKAVVGQGLAKNFEQRAGRHHVSRPDTRVLRSFSIREDVPPHSLLSEHLGITIADLSRVPGDLKNIVDMVSAWCYFIKRSRCLTDEDLKVLVKQSEVFKMAREALKDLSQDGSVRLLEKFREKWVRDQVSLREEVEQATKQAEQAEQKGLQKGMEARNKEIALNMLKKSTDITFISEVTGLSINEIKKLKT